MERVSSLINLKNSWRSFGERKRASLMPDVLPEDWNGTINNRSIQILPWELSHAAANGWTNWQPNPVLQLYSVYTQKLDRYSADSFSLSRMPQFVLLEYLSIDGRNMFLDTPATWNAVFPNYRIVKKDGKKLLLEKRGAPAPLNFSALGTETARFGEWLALPQSAAPVYAKIIIEYSLPGKIITALFRGSPSTITVINRNGDEQTWRVIEDTLRSPVLISLIPGNFDQMASFFEGNRDDDFTVEKIRFSSRRPFLFEKNIRIEWLEAEPAPPGSFGS
jgi:hypothetical protein